MKRLLSVLCITALLLGSITGCGKEEVTLEQPYDIYERPEVLVLEQLFLPVHRNIFQKTCV